MTHKDALDLLARVEAHIFRMVPHTHWIEQYPDLAAAKDAVVACEKIVRPAAFAEAKIYLADPTWSTQAQDGRTVYPIIMSHSEVCIHMRIAGKPRFVSVLDDKSCQVYEVECHGDGNNAADEIVAFSSPISLSEAGIRRDEKGLYVFAQ